MKIEVEGESSPGQANHFYFWAAKDVGKVRDDHRPFGLDNWDELLTATVGGVRYPAQGWNITDYFPLGEGDTWTYNSDWGAYTKTVSGTEEIWGETCIRVVFDEGTVEWYQTDSDGVRFWGSQSPGEPQLTVNPPLFTPNGLYPGDEAASDTTLYLDGVPQGQLVATGRFVGFEDVTVPAGTFVNCLKLEGQIDAPPGYEEMEEPEYIWYALGVGVVKTDSRPLGGDSWRELLSATIGGTPYP